MFRNLINRDNLLDNEVYFIINKKSGCVLNGAGARMERGAPLTICNRNNSQNQQFVLVKKADNEWELTLACAQHLAIDVQSASSVKNANLQLYDKNNTMAQRFRFQKNTDGSYKILTKTTDYHFALVAEHDEENDGTSAVQGDASMVSADWFLERKQK